MAHCPHCHKEMILADGCDFTHIHFQSGKLLQRRRVGEEGWVLPGERCPDCGAKFGFFHHYGCDIERCPKCGQQLIACDCDIIAIMELAPDDYAK